MKEYIKKRLQENLTDYKSGGNGGGTNTPNNNTNENFDRYASLKADIKHIIEKHQETFAEYPGDSYGIIDAVQHVMNELFERIRQ